LPAKPVSKSSRAITRTAWAETIEASGSGTETARVRSQPQAVRVIATGILKPALLAKWLAFVVCGRGQVHQHAVCNRLSAGGKSGSALPKSLSHGFASSLFNCIASSVNEQALEGLT